MPSRLAAIAAACVLFSCAPVHAADPRPPATRPLAAGEWELDIHDHDHVFAHRMWLDVDGESVSGWLYTGRRAPLTGRLHGQDITMELKWDDGTVDLYRGRLAGDRMTGSVSTKPAAPEDEEPTAWTASRAIVDRQGPPRRVDFAPKEFQRELSAHVAPVLHLRPGDTLHTQSVDAAGIDADHVRRSLGGNPLTGPFYVDGAMPGDVLAVTITRLRLTRDTAVSGNSLVPRVVTPDYARAAKSSDEEGGTWHLDRERGVATLQGPSAPMKDFAVAVRPMLGCIGVAPSPWEAAMSTQDSGSNGGNMDFNLVTEGTTVYLPVEVPGALLYVGDGHALQGDGELTGSALETSLDIEITTDVVREVSIDAPRLENADYRMAMGLEGSLDAAIRSATSDLARWLTDDYGLSATDVALLLEAAAEYSVSEVADRNVGVVAKIRKSALATIHPAHSARLSPIPAPAR